MFFLFFPFLFFFSLEFFFSQKQKIWNKILLIPTINKIKFLLFLLLFASEQQHQRLLFLPFQVFSNNNKRVPCRQNNLAAIQAAPAETRIKLQKMNLTSSLPQPQLFPSTTTRLHLPLISAQTSSPFALRPQLLLRQRTTRPLVELIRPRILLLRPSQRTMSTMTPKIKVMTSRE